MNTYFIFGFGFSARAFAKRVIAKGERVIATYRSEKPTLPNVEYVAFDGQNSIDDFLLRFQNVTHIVLSIPPRPEKGDPVIACHGNDLKKLPHLKWVGYLSTTGVYGNADGAEVDETSPLKAKSQRAMARVQAERQWLESGLPVHIFRLAGIYGPKRNVLGQLKAGSARAIDRPDHKFSRIHRDDIAGILEASIARPNAGAIYNVCDDEPAEPADVMEYGAALLGLDPPQRQPFEQALQTMSPMAQSFWQDHKTINNQKIKDELGYQLVYPTYRQGLKALYEDKDF